MTAARMPFADAPVAVSDIVPFYLWTDFETTGLDPNTQVPIEFGCVLTNKWGEIINNSDMVHTIWETEGNLGAAYKLAWNGMDDYVRSMHTKSGLHAHIESVRENWDDVDTTLISLSADLFDLFTEFEIKPKQLQLAGSSIEFDQGFLKKFLPDVYDFIHYRTKNVSSYITDVQNLNPILAKKLPTKREIHRPIPDLEDSLDAWNFILNEFLMPDWRLLSGD